MLSIPAFSQPKSSWFDWIQIGFHRRSKLDCQVERGWERTIFISCQGFPVHQAMAPPKSICLWFCMIITSGSIPCISSTSISHHFTHTEARARLARLRLPPSALRRWCLKPHRGGAVSSWSPSWSPPINKAIQWPRNLRFWWISGWILDMAYTSRGD